MAMDEYQKIAHYRALVCILCISSHEELEMDTEDRQKRRVR
jgi:hypothetical protein